MSKPLDQSKIELVSGHLSFIAETAAEKLKIRQFIAARERQNSTSETVIYIWGEDAWSIDKHPTESNTPTEWLEYRIENDSGFGTFTLDGSMNPDYIQDTLMEIYDCSAEEFEAAAELSKNEIQAMRAKIEYLKTEALADEVVDEAVQVIEAADDL